MKRKLSLQNMYGMRLVFQISEVANFLGISSRSVRRWCPRRPSISIDRGTLSSGSVKSPVSDLVYRATERDACKAFGK